MVKTVKVEALIGPLLKEKRNTRDCEGRIGLIRTVPIWFKIVMQMTQQLSPEMGRSRPEARRVKTGQQQSSEAKICGHSLYCEVDAPCPKGGVEPAHFDELRGREDTSIVSCTSGNTRG